MICLQAAVLIFLILGTVLCNGQNAQYETDQTGYKLMSNDYGKGGGEDYGKQQQVEYGGGPAQQSYGSKQQDGYKQEEKYPHKPYGFGYNVDGKLQIENILFNLSIMGFGA